MKPVSQAFKDAWKEKHGKLGFSYVQFMRRYWNGEAFIYEENWVQFTLRDFVEIGNITWKLDTPLLNEVKASSLILKFKNSDYQLLPSNSSTGLFKPDAVAVDGYEPFLTKFRVLFGYKLADGSIETVTLFTGVAIDYIFDIKGGTVEVNVSGNEYLLQTCDAKNVSDTLTGATTTNTGSRQYTTNDTGIALISNVYDNGVLKTQGTDYQISGLSSFGAGATITTTYDPVGAITYDGKKWLTFQKIEDLVTFIAQAAQLPSYNISPVIFPGDSGAVTTDIGLFSGSAYSPPWFIGNTVTPSITAAGGVLTIESSTQDPGPVRPSWAYTASTPAYGIWSWRMSATLAGIGLGVRVYFISDTHTLDGGGSGFPIVNGYYVELTDSGATCKLVRISNPFSQLVLFSVPTPPALIGGLGAEHIWTVTRNADGSMTVLADDITIGTATDNTYIVSNFFLALALGAPPDGENIINISEITNTIAIELTMADFSGMTCYDAVQKLARLADYEWGFDADGVLFFRSKTVTSSTPVVSVNQSDGVSEVLEFHPGYDTVKNNAQITYETYYREYNSSTLPETRPSSQDRFLSQILQEDYSGFLLAFDPIIAAGRAQFIHDDNYLPKRRVRVKTKIIPFLDLSDVLGFSFYNNPRNKDNIFGDPLELWGVSMFGKPNNVLARDLPGKIVGIIANVNACTAEFELQEVLT